MLLESLREYSIPIDGVFTMSRPDAKLLYTALKKDRSNKSRRILNDIMYYLRKLIKLARTA